MFPGLRWLGVTAGLVLLLAGCPAPPDPGFDNVPDTGSPAGAAGGGGGASAVSGGTDGAGSEQASSDFEQLLAEQFPTCTEPVEGDAWRAEILRLVNLERERAGLQPLVRDELLEQQATQYACEMIHWDFFAHENPQTGTDLRQRAAEFGYDYLIIGENLAAGQTSPAQVMSDWMASPGHRENILHPEFTELGVGVRSGGRYGTYWVQEFGCPLRP